MTPIRLIPFETADGPHNMAADEVMLEAAVAGLPSLRLYGWSVPTLSLGYFQPDRVRASDPRLSPLPYVRRMTGGDTLVHHHELTYALALPAPLAVGGNQACVCRMHHTLAAALHEFGVEARPHEPTGTESADGPLCFRHFTPGDLIVAGHKVVGSAQRKRHGAILTHGGLLLARSEFTPSLPGILELTGVDLRPLVQMFGQAVYQTFQHETGWDLGERPWAEDDCRRIEHRAAEIYSSTRWNAKR